MLSKKGRSKISSVLVFVLLFSMLVPAMAFGAAAVQLKDIADSYAQKEIQALVDSGIISGYEDGTFQPRKAMTRAELAKIIVLSQGLKENADKASAFTDVDKNSWYRGYVGALVDSKITEGTSATTFSPDAKVTREELVVFFIRAMGLEEAAGKLAVDAKLSDLKQVSSWAQAHVSLAFKIGFVNGIDNADGSLKFSPKDSAERQALARLAYEFKTNKSKFVDKAKELANVVTELAVSSASAVSNTSVEVTFNKEISSVDKADFTFDNDLTVTKAELKAESKTVVVLTTSSQTVDKVYKLSYKGKDTGVTVTGVSTAVGGGGGGGGGSKRSQNGLTDDQKISRGGTYTDLTIKSSGIIGPADGTTTTITGTLTLDPGATGEITLQNVDAANVVVASGSENSIKLLKSKIKSLKVAANNQTNKVRIVSLTGASVTETAVESQVIIESVAGSLGNITVGAGAAGKDIELRGTITGSVYVAAAGAKITIAAPKEEGAQPTSISTLKLGSNATVTANEGTTLGTVSIVAPGADVAFGGAGSIQSVTVTKEAAGSTLTLGKGSNVQGLTLNADVKLAGDAAAIGAVKIDLAEGVKVTADDSVKADLVKAAIAAIEAIGDFQEYTAEKEALIVKADIVTSNAILLGAKAYDDITNYGVLKAAKENIVTYALSLTAQNLKIGFAEGDSVSSVTKNLTLPTSDKITGATITWKSSNPDVISNDGEVTRPEAGTFTYVNLIATIAKNERTTNKLFDVRVVGEGPVIPSVTTVTYVTYAKQASVTGLVYGGNPGPNNVAVQAFPIPVGHETDYLIIGFSDALQAPLSGVTVTTNGSTEQPSIDFVNGVTNNTYLALKYTNSRVTGVTYEIQISGLKRASDGVAVTATVYVRQN
ncbi:S-layer homology domain-containing protein [Paenibacillus piri]|uniref:S-layer homology domain-containing protein n=1 Tax=Paenibacillus piri TaxID=2547395 RepID=A0A4V2ZSL4_9BACL|nr:S-layer homology domain-containing protein [Paenibacillus piri]TDF93454.1 S-layer homology domain-containing protein [Paenibacillus piri]